MVESGENIPAPAEIPIVLPLPNMDEDKNEMEDVVVPNEDVDTMMMLGKHYILNYIMKLLKKVCWGLLQWT